MSQTLEELIHSNCEVRNGKNEDELWVCCPFCTERNETEDTKYRLGVNIYTGKAHCFNCDWRSGSDDRFASLENTYKEFARVLDVDESQEVDGEVKRKKLKVEKSEVKLPPEYEPLWKDAEDDDIGKQALKYLLDRGVTKEQIKRHMMGFCATGQFRYRIIFPVLSRKLGLYSFTGRDFKDVSSLKYLNSEGRKTLYGLEATKLRTDITRAVLVEGVFDVFAVERAIPEVIALGRLGNSLSEKEIKNLKKFKEITVWPDPDKPGIRGTIRTVETILTAFPEMKIRCVMPRKENDTDPGDLGVERKGLRVIRKRWVNAKNWTPDLIMRLRTFAVFN